jgi:hypothetical protein
MPIDLHEHMGIVSVDRDVLAFATLTPLGESS